MNQDLGPISGPDADAHRLRDYGDALAAGIAPPPADELEATMLRVHHAMTPALTRDTPLSPGRKAAIWEDIMHQASLSPSAPTLPVARPHRSRPRQAPAALPAPGNAPSRRREWRATASLSVMLAIAIGLIGVFVALRFDPPQQAPSDGISLFAAPTQPSVPDSCTPNPAYTSPNPSATSLEDLPEPRYTPAKPVSYEQGLAIQQAYLNYLACSWQNLSETAPAIWPTPDADMQSVMADRMRILWNDMVAAPAHEKEIQNYICRPIADELIAGFPLPVNRTMTFAVQNVEPDHQNARAIFLPGDVYQLPDGRYGAMIGTVSTAALQNLDVLTANDILSFVAFVEQDGHYYVDEDIIILRPGNAITDPPASATPRTEITYHRFTDPTCADAATPTSGR
ncbi:MAG: hypothetical protein ACTHMX_10040 [Thermomicrobiales bacterium]